MGIGFMVCVDKSIKDEVLAELEAMGEKAYEIGYKMCIRDSLQKKDFLIRN